MKKFTICLIIAIILSGCTISQCRPDLMRPKPAIPLDSPMALSGAILEMVPGVQCRME